MTLTLAAGASAAVTGPEGAAAGRGGPAPLPPGGCPGFRWGAPREWNMRREMLCLVGWLVFGHTHTAVLISPIGLLRLQALVCPLATVPPPPFPPSPVPPRTAHLRWKFVFVLFCFVFPSHHACNAEERRPNPVQYSMYVFATCSSTLNVVRSAERNEFQPTIHPRFFFFCVDVSQGSLRPSLPSRRMVRNQVSFPNHVAFRFVVRVVPLFLKVYDASPDLFTRFRYLNNVVLLRYKVC